MRKFGLCVLAFMVVWVLGFSHCVSSAEEAPREKLRVITTLFPLYDWARQISGDAAEVSLLLPPGVEAHSFEPTPRDIARIGKADVFIYMGDLMEPWVDKVLKGASGKDLLIIDASKGIRPSDDGHEHKPSAGKSIHKGGHHDEREHHRHEHADHLSKGEHRHDIGEDPHIWLEFNNAQKIVDSIASGYILKDPARRGVYEQRAREYNAELSALDASFERALATCKHRTLIYGGHFAFGHFARRFNIEYISPYKGFAPDAEPTPRDIADLIKTMKKSGIKHIFYEEGVEPKVAKVISEETGAEMLLLHGAHNVSKDELAHGETYISIMKENLDRLAKGLECR